MTATLTKEFDSGTGPAAWESFRNGVGTEIGSHRGLLRMNSISFRGYAHTI